MSEFHVMTEFHVGDRVKVEAFEGVLEDLNAYQGGYLIRDDNKNYHEVFPLSSAIELTKVEPPRPEGQIVRDEDGDVFIWEPSVREDEPWRLVWSSPDSHWGQTTGKRYELNTPNEPITVL